VNGLAQVGEWLDDSHPGNAVVVCGGMAQGSVLHDRLRLATKGTPLRPELSVLISHVRSARNLADVLPHGQVCLSTLQQVLAGGFRAQRTDPDFPDHYAVCFPPNWEDICSVGVFKGILGAPILKGSL
jgi:hypothetical protein